MLVIPNEPDSLYTVLNKFWDGTPCADERLYAEIWVTKVEKGLRIRVQAPELENQKIPDAPKEARVDGLWNYDVVELFFVGKDGKYLEVELGAGGHYLVLGFKGVRNLENDYKEFATDIRYSQAVPGMWQSGITIPWEMLPKELAGFNAFAITDGQFLAMNAVPGNEPDFHQPATYPEASYAA